MVSESVIWTLLPNGVDAATGELCSTIFVSPRLRTDGGGPVELDAFPTFRHWAQEVSRLRFVAEIDGLGGFDLTPDPDKVAGPDPATWDLLFSGDVTVEDAVVKDLSSRRLFSFPADKIASDVLSLYADVGAQHPTEHPSVLDPTLVSLASELGGIGDNHRKMGVYPGLDGWFNADPTRGDNPGRFVPSSYTAGSRQRSFVLANRFYDRYQDGERLRDRRGPIAADQVPPRPRPPGLDFHRYVAALGDYPELLRRLGLAIDVRMPAEPVIAQHQMYRLTVNGDAPDWMHAQTARPWMNYQWYGRFFLPRTRPNGRRDIADGQLQLDSTDFYAVHQIDIDGSALKTTHVAGTIARRIALVDKQQGATMAPTTSSLPALRGGGLTVVRHNAAAAVVKQFDQTADLAEQEKSGQRLTLWADDVIRGFRYDVERDGNGRFRSLVDRIGTYRYHRADDTVVDLPVAPDQGYVKGSSTTSVPEEQNKNPDLYLHEAVASWSGWSMVAARPGGGVNTGDEIDDPWPKPREIDKGIPLETSFTATPGSLPRLRYGSTYRLRARTVDLAGNSVDTETIDDARASHPVSFKRWEPVPAPSVLPQRTTLDHNGNTVAAYGEGESQMRMVIRSTAGMTVDDYLAQNRIQELLNSAKLPYLATDDRWIVAPKTSQQMAEWHGVFDDAIGSGDPARIQAAFEIACRSTEELPAFAPGDTCSIPYLPDVSSRGVRFNRFPFDPAIYRRVDWPTDTGAWWDRQPIRVVVTSGPAAAPVTPAGMTVAPVWDAATRTLTVHLPQAEMVTVRLSSAVDPADLDIQGMYELILDRAAAKANDRRHEALDSRNWMLTPWVDLTFVHAVEKPLTDPLVAVTNAGMLRNPHEHFCVLQGAITNHAKSTGRLDVDATWTEQVDDIFEDVPADGVNGGVRRQSRSHVGDFLIEAFENDALTGRDDVTTPAGKGNTHRLRHEFGDTRHRVVEYRAQATTRFREYFPPQVIDGVEKKTLVVDGVEKETEDPLIKRTGPATTLVVPSSRRPDPPDIAYIIPTFRWTDDPMPTPPPDPVHGYVPQPAQRRTRHGGGLRVYLRRPWYSSGDGEQLGVVLHDQPWVTWPVDQRLGILVEPADQVRADTFVAQAVTRGAITIAGGHRPQTAEQLLLAAGLGPRDVGGDPDPMVLRSGLATTLGRLGVMLANPGLQFFYGPDPETLVTQVGADPVFASAAVPADGPYIHQFPLRASVRGAVSLTETNKAKVTVVGHVPTFDPVRKLWYCDIELNPGASYQPFVRLALCRYQPHSIDGCHISRVVRADFAQLLPDRVATVTRRVDTGVTVVLRGPSGVGQFGAQHFAAEGITLTRAVTATVQHLGSGDDPDLGWTAVATPVEAKATVGAAGVADVSWLATLPAFVRQPGWKYRVLLQEFEIHPTDEDRTGDPFGDARLVASAHEFGNAIWARRRLVYADTFTV